MSYGRRFENSQSELVKSEIVRFLYKRRKPRNWAISLCLCLPETEALLLLFLTTFVVSNLLKKLSDSSPRLFASD